jgi:flagellar basal body-associated protein FliL
MAKLDALKLKLAAAKAALSEKLDKIAFIKRYREKTAPQVVAAKPASSSSGSLGAIYREGGVGTRLQVILFFLFAAVAVAATVNTGRKMWKRVSSSESHEEFKKDYSAGLVEMNTKIVENANLISLGKFTSNVYSEGRSKFMAVDIWIRVSDPATADYANKNDLIINDRVIDALQQISRENVDPLSAEGKVILKSRIQESINKSLAKGTAEDVLFQNMVVQ